MKKLFILLFIGLGLQNCTNLDVQPVGADTANNTFTSAEAYRQYLAKLYASYSLTGQDGPAGDSDISIVTDEGFTSYIRAYWKAQELTTDEAVVGWTDAGIRDLHDMNWSSENQFIRVIYYRVALIVSIANDLIEQASEENLKAYGVPSDEYAEIQEYVDEARFLRALAYWHAMDLFGSIPLVTKITAEAPQQASRSEIFSFIESELTDIESSMKDPRSGDYGRADRGAVWTLQAKLFLNAESMIGQDRFTDCLTACNKIIESGYSLNEVYESLFMIDNHTSNEIIFPIVSDGLLMPNWGNTTFLVHAAIGGSMVEEDYGITGGWAGLRTTSSLLDKFSDLTGDTDSRAMFYTDGQSVEIEDIATFTQGVAVPKFVNVDMNGTRGSDLTHVDTDYPMFRLGDVYLIYAEAVLRGGQGGDIGTALNYINDLRQRAYGDESGNVSMDQLNLPFILDERSRELYWEATRRIDLIRFGKYAGAGYVWPWKGGVKEGMDVGEFRNVFPIPASDLSANPNLEQNPGY